jgi:hypothetical protein
MPSQVINKSLDIGKANCIDSLVSDRMDGNTSSPICLVRLPGAETMLTLKSSLKQMLHVLRESRNFAWTGLSFLDLSELLLNLRFGLRRNVTALAPYGCVTAPPCVGPFVNAALSGCPSFCHCWFPP